MVLPAVDCLVSLNNRHNSSHCLEQLTPSAPLHSVSHSSHSLSQRQILLDKLPQRSERVTLSAHSLNQLRLVAYSGRLHLSEALQLNRQHKQHLASLNSSKQLVCLDRLRQVFGPHLSFVLLQLTRFVVLGSSLFGQSKPGGFGTTSTFGAQPATNSLFGTQQAAQPTTGLFGSTTTGTGLFGQQPNANPFGASGQNPVGTTIKFSPMLGQDTAVKNGNQSTVTTKNFCICTMKEYEEKKSLEELRYEDYQAGRKFGTAAAPAQPGSLFGQPAAQPSTGKFYS